MDSKSNSPRAGKSPQNDWLFLVNKIAKPTKIEGNLSSTFTNVFFQQSTPILSYMLYAFIGKIHGNTTTSMQIYFLFIKIQWNVQFFLNVPP